MIGHALGPYRVLEQIGAGAPACVRARDATRELRRGLAEAKTRTRR
jgi:hypothetical protein